MPLRPAPPAIRASTRLVGIIGWPVSSSLSPVVHNAAFSALDMDWAYVPLPVPPGFLTPALAGLGPLGFAGANVTMPHKEETATLLEELSPWAARVRAVNTIVVGSEGLVGHNTDAPGFARFVEDDVGFDPTGRSALIYGAGGAARACVVALARSGLARVIVAVRDPGRAGALVDAMADASTEVDVIPIDRAPAAKADLIVNATPVGRAGEPLPVPGLDSHTVVIDLLYRPAVTPLLEAARAAGSAAFGGIGLLLHQAALSFELWTSRVPPMEIMSAAALAAMAESAAGG
jgi:shikimate dehydrogenase